MAAYNTYRIFTGKDLKIECGHNPNNINNLQLYVLTPNSDINVKLNRIDLADIVSGLKSFQTFINKQID